MYLDLICTTDRGIFDVGLGPAKKKVQKVDKRSDQKKFKRPYEKSQDPEYVIKTLYSGIRHTYTYIRVRSTYITHFGAPFRQATAH